MSTPVSARRIPKKPFPARWGRLPGGTIINVVAAVIFFGLFTLAAWWVIKGLGEAGEQYTGAMIDAKDSAMTLQCQTNLRTIYQNLQMYAISKESFPPSLQALVEWSGGSQVFRCPARDGADYIYIPGQSGDMSGENVLVFEPNAVHDGHCNVLRLSGTVELLTPEQLREALAQTRARVLSQRR